MAGIRQYELRALAFPSGTKSAPRVGHQRYPIKQLEAELRGGSRAGLDYPHEAETLDNFAIQYLVTPDQR